MQVDEGGAAGGERPAVGHADGGRLLKAEDVANVGRVDQRVHERHLGRAGIAEDVGYALIAQDVDENVARASGHRLFPSVRLASYTSSARRECEAPYERLGRPQVRHESRRRPAGQAVIFGGETLVRAAAGLIARKLLL